MSQSEVSESILQLFLRLRRRGFKLGLDELRLALQAVEAGFAGDEHSMMMMLEILWCHTRSHQSQIRLAWEELKKSQQEQQRQREKPLKTSEPEESYQEPEKKRQIQTEIPEPIQIDLEVQPKSEVAALPVQVPFDPMEREEMLDLQRYFPVSRRSMVYGWRALRRWVADGAKNVLDVPATVQAVTEQGYYLGPVYQRRRRNAARLLMLIDQNGSMMPFHRFTRDLVETACEESSLLPENVQAFYFHNVPVDGIYQDAFLTEPIQLNEALAGCDSETSVLIVSDAGAARGFRRQERIQETTRFLRRVQQRTTLIAWLNPMSQGRWVGSSAEILAYLVPMFAMDRLGFADAISSLRGLVGAGAVEL
jgi:hypothetical protein